MVAMNFNAQQFKPQYGGGGNNLPVGEYLGVIVDSREVDNSKGTGKMIALDLTPVEGPMKDQLHTDNLNYLHPNQDTVRIAGQQLSAYCHVVGKPNGFQNDTREIHGIPFRFVVGYQKGQEPTPDKPNGGYTEIKKLKYADGRELGQTAPINPNGGQQQQMPQQQMPPAGQVQPQGQPQQFQQPQQQQPQGGFQAPQEQQPQGGWNGQAQPQQQPQGGGFGQPDPNQQQQPQGGGFGQPQQQQPQGGFQQQPAAQGGGWGNK